MAELWEQGIIALRLIVAPAAGASLLVFLAVRLLGGERLGGLASALAVAAGLLAANHFRGLLVEIAQFQHPSVEEARHVVEIALKPKRGVGPSDLTSPPSPLAAAEVVPAPPRIVQKHYWLPWLAGLAMLTELLVRLPSVPGGLAWLARALVALFVARVITPNALGDTFPDVPWLLGFAILLQWSVLAALARQWKDGFPAMASILSLAAATLILLQQVPGPSLSEMAVLCLAPLLGVALAAWLMPSDTGPALAAAAVVLPAILVLGHDAADPPRAWLNYSLAGLAPLALALVLHPYACGIQGWKRWLLALALPLIPLALAVVRVLQETPLPS